VHPRFRTPHLSTLLTGSVMAVAAGVLPLAVLSQLVSIGSLLAFLLVCIGVMVLRKTAPAVERPFRVPWVPWVPILGGLSCLAQMVSLPRSTWERLVVWLLLGWAIYFLYSRRHARALRLARDASIEAALSRT
jgi:APA family basic amino acid/polyamine antiporter